MTAKPLAFWISVLISVLMGYVLPEIWYSFITGLNPFLGYIAMFVLLLVLIFNIRLIGSVQHRLDKIMLTVLFFIGISIAAYTMKSKIDASKKEIPRRLYQLINSTYRKA